MAIPSLPDDFKEFLKLLGSNGVEYLLIGGYAVNVHGCVRTTNDLDIWINVNTENAARIDRSVRQFGFAAAELTADLFLTPNNVIRMGLPPLARLRENKAASGRRKDLADLEGLSE
jgi:hypothetical protein